VAEQFDADHLAGAGIDGALMKVSSKSDMPLSAASAPNSAPKGADARATGKPPRKPSIKFARLIGDIPPGIFELL
jgi:hypothetical protein